MEVLTGEQMRRVDRRAIDELGIASLVLMESAGQGVAAALLRDYPHAAAQGIVVLCGKGNNGGDGLVAARHLARLGVTPRVLLFCAGDDLTGDAALNYRAARGSGLRIEEIPDAGMWSRVRGFLDHPVIVLDALLGTGIKGGVRGLLADVIRDVNDSATDVVSVDIPSGLDADSSQVEGTAVGADRTYTLCRPKLPLVVEPASLHAGRWMVVPIGIPDGAVAAEHAEIEWIDADAVRVLVSPRDVRAHKGDYGHLLAVAGSAGKTGAAVLLARGALRVGAGLVTVATPLSSLATVASQQAELMTERLAETRSGALAESGADAALALLEERDALALGPGLGTEAETRSAVMSIVTQCTAPAVLDADGLNAVAATDGDALEALRRPTWPLVLTPHPGEAARLLDTTTTAVQADRLAHARRLAERSGAVVVLKGHRSLVASPDGRVAVNSSGNPGMATAGMGDVLTGMIGALLARRMDAHDAARLAVFVHGDAADRAAAKVGEESLTASDVIASLPESLGALAESGETEPW